MARDALRITSFYFSLIIYNEVDTSDFFFFLPIDLNIITDIKLVSFLLA